MMIKVRTNPYDISELEMFDLNTVQENGQRFYCDKKESSTPA